METFVEKGRMRSNKVSIFAETTAKRDGSIAVNESVSNRQIFAFIFFALVGVTVISLPRTMAVNAGTGAWFTLLLSSLLFLIPTAVITTLNRMFPGQTMFQYSALLLGRPLSVVLSVIYGVYFLGLFSYVCWVAVQVVKMDFLIKTPLGVLFVLLIAVSMYATSRGRANLGRLLEMEMYFILVIIVFLHTMMFAKGDKYQLLPLYNPSKTVEYIRAVAIGAPAFLGMEVLTTLPFHQQNLRRGRINALWAVVLAGVGYIFIVESCIAILGVDDMKNYNDVLIVAVRRIDAPFLEILRRVDLVFLMAWLMAVLCTMNVFNYGYQTIVCELFPNLGKWPAIALAALVAYVVGNLPFSYEQNLKNFSTFIYALAPFTAFLLPALLLIMTRIRRHVVPKGN